MRVVDIFDDLGESLLVFFEKQGSAIPTSLKTASWREPTDLKDRDFALILMDNGVEHRKYACFDPGNTAVSAWYLLHADHRLPRHAVKVAAANLVRASYAHNVDVPQELMDLADMDVGVLEAKILDERRVQHVQKVAEAPEKKQPKKDANPDRKPAQSRKPSSVGKQQAPASPVAPAPQEKTTPTVGQIAGTPAQHVSGVAPQQPTAPPQPQAQPSQKTASVFDLLQHAEQVWDDLDCYDRHEVAVPLCKEASISGAAIPEYIWAYGGEELNPEFARLMELRKEYVSDPTLQDEYGRLAKVAGVLELDDLVQVLHHLDDYANITNRYGSRILDPVLCVYGQQEKQASWKWNYGGYFLTENLLCQFACSAYSRHRMKALFTEDLIFKFKDNPVKIFESLALPQQKIIANMVSQYTTELA